MFDLIGDLSFGQSFGGLQSGSTHSWVTAVKETIEFSGLQPAIIAYPFLAKIIGLFVSNGNKGREKHLAYAKRCVDERLGLKTDRKDFLSYIVRHNSDESTTSQEIFAISATLVLAGLDTYVVPSRSRRKFLENTQLYVLALRRSSPPRRTT